LERALDDMSLAQLRVLTLIASSPERAGRIAAKAALSRASLSSALDGLVTRGWVRRLEVAGDRRGVSLEITTRGRRALDDARAATAERLHALLATLDGTDAATVLDGLATLRDALTRDFERRHAPADPPPAGSAA
jgi:DNA-binding MarR family transcriptional regulator